MRSNKRENEKTDFINIIGLGYIGLPAALMFAANGFNVVGTDIDLKKIQRLNKKELIFHETGIDNLFEKATLNGILFQNKPIKADVYIIAVPTPYLKSTNRIDDTYVIQAVQDVLEVCDEDSIIAIESTVAPGTIDKKIRELVPKGVKLAHVPERIIPGKIIDELMHNSRTIGVDDARTGERLKCCYQTFCKGEISITDIKTAEMAKVVENTYRDINIGFANELTKICDAANLDVREVIRIANKHPRVNILSPGPGVGGHCISVDPWFLVGDFPRLSNIILAARRTNDSMPEFVMEKVSKIMSMHNIFNLSRVGFYGLTYKENVDDIRESPTIQLVECMKNHLSKGAFFYDPYINEEVVENQRFDFNDFIEQSDLIVVMIGHDEIIQQQEKLNDKIVFDTRNVISKAKVLYHI